MWFDHRHKPRYDEIIAKAISESNCHLEPYRIDQPVTGDSIPVNILEGILNSRLVLFEISYITQSNTIPVESQRRFRNENVMYELGLAQAWRLPEEIIVIRDDPDLLPFDIQAFRVHTYDPSNADGSIRDLQGIINRSLQEIDRTKSMMVERAARSLDMLCYKFMRDMKAHYFSEKEIKYDPATSHIISRLFDLGLLWFDTYDRRGSYAYHWTELGRDVCMKLGIEVGSKEDS